ncbi:MAG: sigma-54 dependent transcriptional regulator [Nitrospira sp.]|nr:sigma-54 dependent transcriptional regulator [Nitrospira sp.]MDH4245085.1 sigma-54 dependent transcriptional regulator [Nitrospira sp.]MDH4357379.1 sigma-54 dependent transcriptional regulator [Nitrospira sp.]MDH5319643.1 sigma-54 dependent transcriptional regulator [Nitrospira sp.]
MRAKILIVDDDPDILLSLQNRVSFMGHDPLTATNGKDALRAIQEEEPDLVLLDLELPLLSGLDVLKQVSETSVPQDAPDQDTSQNSATYTTPLIVMLTAYGTIERAVQAMQLGAFDFVPKPFTSDHLTVVIKKALDTVALYRQVATLRKEVDVQFEPALTTNKQMSAQLAIAKQAASSPVTVLLLGETGTGKEVVARAIHRWSPRSAKPFVAVNCAAFPENLLENELFGHEKGAFTGAIKREPGKIEMAEGGTLFLDEIGDMPLTMQSHLLRVLNDKTFYRVGGTREVRADVRFLAATNKDLSQAIRQGTFREDLYFRLAVITVTLPPLRERLDDLPALAEHFLTQPGKFGLNRRCLLSDSALQALQRYPWPGNVRELENVLTRAMVLCPGDTIGPEHLALTTTTPLPTSQAANTDVVFFSYHQSMDAYGQKLIEAALRRNAWNQTKAAAELGLQRTYLTKLLRQKQISAKPPTSP